MELSFPLCSSSPGPVSAQAVAVGQVSSLEMVVQLLIFPAGFGRFFPRWHMVQEEDLHSRADVRERPAAPDRGAEPGIQRWSTRLRQLQ